MRHREAQDGKRKEKEQTKKKHAEVAKRAMSSMGVHMKRKTRGKKTLKEVAQSLQETGDETEAREDLDSISPLPRSMEQFGSRAAFTDTVLSELQRAIRSVWGRNDDEQGERRAAANEKSRRKIATQAAHLRSQTMTRRQIAKSAENQSSRPTSSATGAVRNTQSPTRIAATEAEPDNRNGTSARAAEGSARAEERDDFAGAVAKTRLNMTPSATYAG